MPVSKPNYIILMLLCCLASISAPAGQRHHIDIYAHRGFRAIAPENSLPAFAAAMKLGVDVIDMDINMTKDGALVVTHDLTLNPQITQTSDGKWITRKTPIKDLTLNELERFEVGRVKPDSKFHRMYPHHIPMSGVRIPTLEQVIRFVKQHETGTVRFQIEMKTDPTQPGLSVKPLIMAQALAKVIKRTHIQDRTEVQAFQWQALVDLQRLIPEIKTGYLTEPDYNPANQSLESKVGNGRIWTSPLLARNYNYDYPRMIKKLGGRFWEPYEFSVTEKQIEHAHALGLKVITWGWTEQEHSDFNYRKVSQLIDWGVDGIITDRPDILRGLLTVKGYNVP